MKRPKADHSSGSRLRWLFFETLVIVLGVLVALGINDWWTERQDRDLERAYLARMLDEVREDTKYLERFSSDLPNRKLAVLREIAPVVRGRQPIPDDPMEFLGNVSRGGMGGFAASNWIKRTTYDDLISTGNLRLIRDTALRQHISTYYQASEFQMARLRPRVSGYVPFVHAHMPAELRDDLTQEAMEAFGIERALAAFTSPEFESLLNKEINLALFMTNNESYELALEMERLLVARLAE
jgi:hypothetical protein